MLCPLEDTSSVPTHPHQPTPATVAHASIFLFEGLNYHRCASPQERCKEDGTAPPVWVRAMDAPVRWTEEAGNKIEGMVEVRTGRGKAAPQRT